MILVIPGGILFSTYVYCQCSSCFRVWHVGSAPQLLHSARQSAAERMENAMLHVPESEFCVPL